MDQTFLPLERLWKNDHQTILGPNRGSHTTGLRLRKPRTDEAIDTRDQPILLWNSFGSTELRDRLLPICQVWPGADPPRRHIPSVRETDSSSQRSSLVGRCLYHGDWLLREAHRDIQSLDDSF